MFIHAHVHAPAWIDIWWYMHMHNGAILHLLMYVYLLGCWVCRASSTPEVGSCHQGSAGHASRLDHSTGCNGSTASSTQCFKLHQLMGTCLHHKSLIDGLWWPIVFKLSKDPVPWPLDRCAGSQAVCGSTRRPTTCAATSRPNLRFRITIGSSFNSCLLMPWLCLDVCTVSYHTRTRSHHVRL